MATTRPRLIVFANEKGGTGKSTSCIHTAVALAMQGAQVALIDLDARQKTSARYLENRTQTAHRRAISLPIPRFAAHGGNDPAELDALVAEMSQGADFVIVDTPGRDDPMARHIAGRADTLVTPINDSFVDLDLIGEVEAETFRVKRPSFYAELIWDARKARAKTDGVTIDWVLLRNRLHHVDARNQRRVGKALEDLAKRVGFRIIPGLSERVIFRELFPSGLTLLDKGHLGELGVSHVAARQELREMMAGLSLGAQTGTSQAA